MIVSTVIPFVFCALILFVYTTRVGWFGRESTKLRRQSTQVILLVFYLVLPSVSTVIFLTFQCDRDFGIPGVSFLIVDYSIRCDGARYEFMWYYSIAAIIVYPVGVSSNVTRNYDIELFHVEGPFRQVNLAYLIALTQTARGRRAKHIAEDDEIDKDDTEDADESASSMAFLFDAYRPECWYWEVVDSVRRCALTGAFDHRLHKCRACERLFCVATDRPSRIFSK